MLGCYASRSSLALANMRGATQADIFFALAHIKDVTLADLLLHLHTCWMLRQQAFLAVP